MQKDTKKITINFPIVFHFHQPVGNYETAISEAYSLSYKPLLKTIEKYAGIKVCLHFSGYLLEWLVKKHPDFIKLLKKLIKRKQVEILGGAYYEPVISMIPDEDKFSQIKKLSEYIKKILEVEIKGFWLAERVWEPQLARILSLAGIEYVLIDDYHIRLSKDDVKDFFYTFVTEDQGYSVKIVPMNEHLRYIVPWRNPQKTINFLKSYASDSGDRLICLGGDAEKYGVWGTTHRLCYHNGEHGKAWLDTFFNKIIKTRQINNLTLSEYYKKYTPKELIYIPTTAYDKLGFWVLSSNNQQILQKYFKKNKKEIYGYNKKMIKFINGGFWRQFLTKYYESNNMHKKMMYVRDKLMKAEKQSGKNRSLNEALEYIFKAQCNDVYWHGQFGGIYFLFMRINVYSYLIKAEKLIDSLCQKKKNLPVVIEKDIDKDGVDEILIETSLINIYLHPSLGGSIFEIDLKEKNFNFLNAMKRRREPYYSKSLNCPQDRWRRYGFIDHFIDKNVELHEIIYDLYKDYGKFARSFYKSIIKSGKNKIDVSLGAESEVGKDKKSNIINITRNFTIIDKSSRIEVGYRIKNCSSSSFNSIHYTELPFILSTDVENISFTCDEEEKDFLEDEILSGRTISVKSGSAGPQLNLNLFEVKEITKYSLYTYARTNGGYDTLYQGTVLGFKTPLILKPGEIFKWKICLIF